VNAGTATLKIALFEMRSGLPSRRAATNVSGPSRPVSPRFGDALDVSREPIAAIGHRVVHGGDAFTTTVRIDDEVEEKLKGLLPLAPLHNSRALDAIRNARRALPDVPSFAVFDTAFHADRPRASLFYALPEDVGRALRLRRYGFHGIAHAALIESLAAADCDLQRLVTLSLARVSCAGG
jgi:acetate kinase